MDEMTCSRCEHYGVLERKRAEITCVDKGEQYTVILTVCGNGGYHHILWTETKYTRYLDALRESGLTNMFEAAPYLVEHYPELSTEKSNISLANWMLETGRRDDTDTSELDNPTT